MRRWVEQKLDRIVMDCNPNFGDYQIISPDIITDDELIITRINGYNNIVIPDRLLIDNCKLPLKPVSKNMTVVLDYSSPNVAKPLHVGHLRGMLVGDNIGRVLEYNGYNIVRQNHIGDRNYKTYIDKQESLDQINYVYRTLGIKLKPENIRGESSYDLKATVDLLRPHTILSDGSLCLFFDKYETPLIIQKQNGEYTYATADFAALHYRLNDLKADKLIYVTDNRQRLHFELLFDIACKIGWARKEQLVHIMTGCILGQDKKPLRTRSGDNAKLVDLLSSIIGGSRKQAILNLSAIKYVDCRISHNIDYIFEQDKMLSLESNTSMYLQYTYARAKSILRKSKINLCLEGINNREERELVRHIVKYDDVLCDVCESLRINMLTNYLFGLAKRFNTMYAKHTILGNPDRLYLCVMTAETIKHGLKLLGIPTISNI